LSSWHYNSVSVRGANKLKSIGKPDMEACFFTYIDNYHLFTERKNQYSLLFSPQRIAFFVNSSDNLIPELSGFRTNIVPFSGNRPKQMLDFIGEKFETAA
jgi:hypothetical protein